MVRNRMSVGVERALMKHAIPIIIVELSTGYSIQYGLFRYICYIIV